MSLKINNNLSQKEQQKIIWNAISAYLLIFVSLLFLFNKTNKFINNSFVTQHVKSAFFIHIGFLITYIIFISFGLFWGIEIFSFTLNNIIASFLSLILLSWLIYGMYQAYNSNDFEIWEMIQIVKNEKLIDVNGDNTFDEKDKLTIMLAYIPFISYYNFAKYRENQIIQNATNLNVFITMIILLFYIFWYENLSLFILLFYIIFVVFIWVNLFSIGNLIDVNTRFIPTSSKIYVWFLALKNYLSKYFQWKEIPTFPQIIIQIEQEQKDLEKLHATENAALKNISIPKWIIYTPFLNIICLFFRNTRFHFHISNGIMLTLLLSISIISSYIWYTPNIIILFFIPILFWLGYLSERPAYTMPFLYDIYSFFTMGFKKTKNFHQKYNQNIDINLKVK